MAYEINIIWVGDKTMPEAQLQNIDRIHANHSGAIINLWVMPKLLNEEMKHKIKNLAYINIKDVKNIVDPLTSPKTHETIQLFVESQQWASVSDILRLLILTRHLDKSQPSKRFYIEPDNSYPNSKFFKKMIKDKGFLFHSDGGMTARCDSMYIDVQHEIGNEFKKRLRTSMELVLGDGIINEMLKTIFLDAPHKPSAYDIMFTTGSLNSTLLQLVMFRRPSFFKDCVQLKFSTPGIYSNLSWINNTSGKNPERIEAAICSIRFIELLEDAIVNIKPKKNNIVNKTHKLVVNEKIKVYHDKNYYHSGVPNFLVNFTRFSNMSSTIVYNTYYKSKNILEKIRSNNVTPMFEHKSKDKKISCDTLTIATCTAIGLAAAVLANNMS